MILVYILRILFFRESQQNLFVKISNWQQRNQVEVSSERVAGLDEQHICNHIVYLLNMII